MEQNNNQFYINNYNSNQKNSSLGVAAMVIGIISLLLSVVFVGYLGILSIIFGIIVLCSKDTKKGCAITGLVTGSIALIISMIVTAIAVFAYMKSNIAPTRIDEYDYDDYKDAEKDVFGGHKFLIDKSSSIYFDSYDNSFVWFLSDEDQTDNYYNGTYECYCGEDAIDYTVNTLTEYSVTEQELEDFFKKNEGNPLYTRENYCILVLHKSECYQDGENILEEQVDRYYMGYCYDDTYDFASMNSGEYLDITLAFD